MALRSLAVPNLAFGARSFFLLFSKLIELREVILALWPSLIKESCLLSQGNREQSVLLSLARRPVRLRLLLSVDQSAKRTNEQELMLD